MKDKKSAEKFFTSLGLKLESEKPVTGATLYETKAGYINLHFRLAANAPANAEPLPCEVKKEKQVLWSFWGEKNRGFRGIAKAHKVDDEMLIALHEFREGDDHIVKIIPISHISTVTRILVEGGGTVEVGGMSMEQILGLKVNLGIQTKISIVLSDEERSVRRAQLAREEAAQKEAKKKVRAEQERLRQEMIQTIVSRGKIQVFSADGRPLSGYKITDKDSLSIFDNGVFFILFENESWTKPLRHFRLKKVHGQCKEEGAREVFLERPKRIQEKEDEFSVPPARGIVSLRMKKDDTTLNGVIHIHREHLGAYQTAINSGTLVAFQVKEAGEFQVMKLEKGEAITVGNAVRA